MAMTLEDVEAAIGGLGNRYRELERRWRTLERDPSLQNLLEGGLEWLGPSSIQVDQLSALAVLTGALTINGTLSLGAGGKIEDAQGSYWDDSGITLLGTSVVADSIRFLVPDETNAFSAALKGSALDSGGGNGIGSFYIETIWDAATDSKARVMTGVANGAGTEALVFASLAAERGGVLAGISVSVEPQVLILLDGGNLVVTSLPTSSPGVTGALWNDAGTVKVA